MMKHIIIRLALLSIALLLASCATQNTTARNGSQQAKTAKAGDVASTTVDDPVQVDDPIQADDTLTAELPPPFLCLEYQLRRSSNGPFRNSRCSHNCLRGAWL